MGKRPLIDSSEEGPSRKKHTLSETIGPGDILTDIAGKDWRLGRPVGEGAFGEIFMASDCTSENVSEQSNFVAKVERHTNGPLFVETHFYLRAAKQDLINKWKQKKKKIDGLPFHIASGSHTKLSTKYRFLILPRYSIDLQQILDRHGNKFNVKTVLTIAMQLLDTLEYIHSCGFIHADIKASNILVNEKKVATEEELIVERYKSFRDVRTGRPPRTCRLKKNVRNLRLRSCRLTHTMSVPIELKYDTANYNQVYLLDYGLASRYQHSNGEHKEYCVDERKAHAGTILFCSLDAHRGVQSRRSDLESLGYNMIFWLTNVLPWMHAIEDYEVVWHKKQICMQQLDHFLHFCFRRYVPVFLKKFFQYISSLEFEEQPNYDYCRRVFMEGFREYHYKKGFALDFANIQGWGRVNVTSPKRRKDIENEPQDSVVSAMIRTPLKSNLPAKHVLRQKNKNHMMNWSKILIDPELIIKTGRIRVKEGQDENEVEHLESINIHELNPTEAMLDVYNNYLERQGTSSCVSTSKEKCNNMPVIEGYTAAMMAIHNRILGRNLSNKSPSKIKTQKVAIKHANHSKPTRRYNTRKIKTKF